MQPEPHSAKCRGWCGGRTGAGIVAVGLIAGVAVFVSQTGSEESRIVPGGDIIESTGVRATPGLPARTEPAQALAGDQLFVYGGSIPDEPLDEGGLLNDAALVDASSGDVEILPEPPFAEPLWHATAVGSNDTVLLLGRLCQIGPDYDPESDMSGDPDCRPGTYAAGVLDVPSRSWKAAEIPPSLAELHGAEAVSEALGITADRDAVVQLGDYRSPEFWKLNLATLAWQQLAPSPERVDDACLMNDALLVLTTSYRHNDTLSEEDPRLERRPGLRAGSESDGYVNPRIAKLDLAAESEWATVEVATGQVNSLSPPVLTCGSTGFAAIVPLGSPTADFAIFNRVTGASGDAVDPPMPSPVIKDQVWVGDDLVFLPAAIEAGRPALVYNAASGSWRTVEGVPPVTRGALAMANEIVGYSDATVWTTPADYHGSPDTLPTPQPNHTGVFIVPITGGQ